MLRLVLAAVLSVLMARSAVAEDLVVYSAGSLREAIGDIAQTFGTAHGITVRTEFGHSGVMRDRIEAGEHADVFTSADVGHARTLVEHGKAAVMAVFVRNTLCLLSPQTFGATPATVLDKLLASDAKVGMSPPKSDPLGDYTVRLFGLADHLRAGSAATLQSHAVVLGSRPAGQPAGKTGDADADAILEGRIDASIVYCSGRGRYAKLLPDATLVPFPPELQIGPEYGLAVLNGAPPAAYEFALAVLSPAGQKVLADRGFRPVALPAD